MAIPNGPPTSFYFRCSPMPTGSMAEVRAYDVNRDLWVWSLDGKPFFVTTLDPHGPFGGYLHILLRKARRQDGNFSIQGGYKELGTCRPQ